MIYYFTPYSLDKDYFQAIDNHFAMVEPRDWVFIIDGDTAFLRSDFGQRIEEYVRAYPETGLFTCYASRCHYQCQQGQVEVINRRIAGHLMGIKADTWYKIRDEVKRKAVGKKILGVDTKISNAIIASGRKIHLMKGIYILHYLRMKEGINSTMHLIQYQRIKLYGNSKSMPAG